VAVATLVMTALVLIFAEVLPKTYAINDPERSAARAAGPVGSSSRSSRPWWPPCA
jgi:Mg2+/Co2+ transporter CorB